MLKDIQVASTLPPNIFVIAAIPSLKGTWVNLVPDKVSMITRLKLEWV
jgi:hypothetical protein